MSVIVHVFVGLCTLSVGSAVALGSYLIGVVLGSSEVQFARRPMPRQPLPLIVFDDSEPTGDA